MRLWACDVTLEGKATAEQDQGLWDALWTPELASTSQSQQLPTQIHPSPVLCP